jgi:hypothetical protein
MRSIFGAISKAHRIKHERFRPVLAHSGVSRVVRDLGRDMDSSDQLGVPMIEIYDSDRFNKNDAEALYLDHASVSIRDTREEMPKGEDGLCIGDSCRRCNAERKLRKLGFVRAVNSDAIDARRYRWLRTEEGGGQMVINGELLVGNKLDAAIDAHLAVEPTEK